jgi:hypothetical protein
MKLTELLKILLTILFVKNVIFFAFITRPEQKKRGVISFKDQLIDIVQKIKYHFIDSLILGFIPTFVMLFCTENGFLNDLKAFIPLGLIVIYFTMLSVLGALFLWLINKKILPRSKRLFRFASLSIASFRCIFQCVSGVLLAISVISLIKDKITTQILFIDFVMALLSLIMLIPAIFALELEKKICEQAQPQHPR